MRDWVDFFSYISGNLQIIFGFYCLTKLLHRKVKFCFYVLIAVCGAAILYFIPSGTIFGFGMFVFLLTAGGGLICHADWKSALLYGTLVVLVMLLCYGIVKSLMSIFYPLMSTFEQNVIGILFMLSGEVVSLLLTGFCCHMACRYFSYYETIERKNMFLIFIPILMIFITDEYINSVIYGMVDTDSSQVTAYTNHYQMLVIQLLGVASLFCILSAYKKLLENFRLGTKLTLLEQEERSLNQYVEEAKAHYEKTKSFRHDIKNHITVVKELLQKGELEQALHYMGDMEDMAGELSFPCSTNNPVVDILMGNKLGMAKSMGIDVCCTLFLPYPCGLRDIDVCIILSNALDNAIQACKTMDKDQEKYIRVTGRIQGDFLFMEIENSFTGNVRFIKGTGMSNIKTTAEKYHGAVSVKTQGAVFVLNVLLIIPQHPENISQQMNEIIV